MTRLVTSLFVLATVYSGTVFASTMAASPATCGDFLKRACSAQEQISFDKAAKRSSFVKQASKPLDCDGFLKRTCGKQELAHFNKNMLPLNVRSTNAFSNCDSFLHRACNNREKQGYAQGMNSRSALALN